MAAASWIYQKVLSRFGVRKQGKEALIAIQKGQERTKLLQEYGILPEKRR